MKLAVIPARGGSKRIHKKNIKEFCGKPIIAWSIEAAIESRCFDRIVVSTDDEEIAEVAKKYGAEVPFIRPPELSDDYTGTSSVVKHAIKWFETKNLYFEQICCIYATAPFITANEIRKGLEILIKTNNEYAISVTSFPYPIQRAMRIKDNNLEMIVPKNAMTRSQDLEETYHDAGQFYWGLPIVWESDKPLFSHKICPIPLPRYRVQDIDTLEDWIRAEFMFESIQKMKKE